MEVCPAIDDTLLLSACAWKAYFCKAKRVGKRREMFKYSLMYVYGKMYMNICKAYMYTQYIRYLYPICTIYSYNMYIYYNVYALYNIKKTNYCHILIVYLWSSCYITKFTKLPKNISTYRDKSNDQTIWDFQSHR